MPGQLQRTVSGVRASNDVATGTPIATKWSWQLEEVDKHMRIDLKTLRTHKSTPNFFAVLERQFQLSLSNDMARLALNGIGGGGATVLPFTGYLTLNTGVLKLAKDSTIIPEITADVAGNSYDKWADALLKIYMSVAEQYRDDCVLYANKWVQLLFAKALTGAGSVMQGASNSVFGYLGLIQPVPVRYMPMDKALFIPRTELQMITHSDIRQSALYEPQLKQLEYTFNMEMDFAIRNEQACSLVTFTGLAIPT